MPGSIYFVSCSWKNASIRSDWTVQLENIYEVNDIRKTRHWTGWTVEITAQLCYRDPEYVDL
jgi:hypothetical protein